jgi:hypothetical protein
MPTINNFLPELEEPWIAIQPGRDGSSLEPLLRWMQENAHRDLTLQDIATRARLSTRTLNRRFREQRPARPPAVATPVPDPPLAVPARDHDPSRRAHLTPGRLQLTGQLPRPIQGAGRHQSPGLQAHLPGLRPDRPLKYRSADLFEGGPYLCADWWGLGSQTAG